MGPQKAGAAGSNLADRLKVSMLGKNSLPGKKPMP
jgi:hypothetical protein